MTALNIAKPIEGCCTLESFAKPKIEKLRPELPRAAGMVPLELSSAFTECRMGAKPWPLYVYGDVGTGKTRFALLVNDWYGGRFFDFADLWAEYVTLCKGELRAEASIVSPLAGDALVSQGKWFDVLKASRLVILDDVGRRKDTEGGTARELLCRLLDVREGLPTICIGNLTPKEIESNYDARTASRMCGRSWVCVRGKDRRLK